MPGRPAPEGEAEAAGRRECRWQRDQIPEAIRELVLDDQRLRNDLCWSAFDLLSVKAAVRAERPLMAPFYVNEGVLRGCSWVVTMGVAGPGSDFSEVPAPGCEPAALERVDAPMCPPGPVAVASASRSVASCVSAVALSTRTGPTVTA